MDNLQYGFIGVMSDDIEKKDFKNVPWYLYRLYDFLDGFAPNLSSMFDKHKTEILKEILTTIKNSDDFNDNDIASMLTSLRLLGITWPEIDIIEKSIKAKQITENDDHDEVDDVYNFSYEMIDSVHYMDVLDYILDSGINDINQHPRLKKLLYDNMPLFANGIIEELVKWYDHKTVERFIADLKNLGIAVPQPQIQATINSKLDYIKNKFLETLIDTDYESFSDIIRNCDVLNKLGVDIGINDIIDFEKNKQNIIKGLLTMLSHGFNQDVYNTVRHFKTIGTDWPEIDVIEKSVSIGLNESTDSDYFIWHRSHQLAIFFSSTNLFPKNDIIGKQSADMSAHLNSIKDQTLSYIDNKLKHWLTSGRTLAQSLMFIAAVKWGLHGNLWPELETLLDNNKQVIIKTLLLMVKEVISDDTYSSDQYWGKPNVVLQDAIYLKPNWSELVVMQNALSINNRQLNESQLPLYYIHEFERFNRNAFYNFIHGWRNTADLIPYTDTVVKWANNQWKTDHYGNNDAAYALKLLIDTDQAAHWIAAFKPMLENHKTDIVAHLLRQIKRGATYYAARDLQPFLIFSLDWPEIDVIKDHLLKNGNDKVKRTITDLTESQTFGVNYIVNYLDKTDIDSGEIISVVCYAGNRLYHGIIDLEDIKPIIEDRKPRIVKALLDVIKTSDDLYSVRRAIYYLQAHFYVDWPELDIIVKSIDEYL